MRLDLSNSGQVGDWLEVRDVRSIADEGVRSQLVADLEAFARDPQAATLESVLNPIVTNSSLSLRHPTSRTYDLRSHRGGVQVGHLSDVAYGTLLDRVKQAAPRWLAELRDQAAEAAKVARATARSLASEPMIASELLVKAMGLEAEADHAGRAAIMVKAALDRRRSAGVLGKAVILDQQGRPAPATVTKAASPAATVAAGLREQAAQLRRQAALLGTVDPAQERRLLCEAFQVEQQAAEAERYGRR